ncbi:MAG: hypothetical protein PWQ35_412 [Patescibacteria group bacterium]|nr:hypothetical protein [Patescibacteria group bacterium]
MHLLNFDQIFHLLTTYRYLLLFPIAIAEGPVITMISGYLSYLNFLNFFIAYIIMIIGDLAGDIVYYAIGRWGRLRIIEKYGHYVGVTRERIINMEQIFESNDKRALIGGKFIFGIGGLIIIASGAAKYNFKKFLSYCILGTIPKSLILMIIGYYFGHAYIKIAKYFDYTAIISIFLFIFICVAYYYFQKYMKNSILKKEK